MLPERQQHSMPSKNAIILRTWPPPEETLLDLFAQLMQSGTHYICTDHIEQARYLIGSLIQSLDYHGRPTYLGLGNAPRGFVPIGDTITQDKIFDLITVLQGIEADFLLVEQERKFENICPRFWELERALRHIGLLHHITVVLTYSDH